MKENIHHLAKKALYSIASSNQRDKLTQPEGFRFASQRGGRSSLLLGAPLASSLAEHLPGRECALSRREVVFGHNTLCHSG